MNNHLSPLTDNLFQAVTVLAENLAHSEPFMAEQAAEKKFTHDTEASSLLMKLSEAQAGIRKRQSSRGITENDLKELRDLQKQVQFNLTIQEYEAAQEETKRYVQEINQEISSLVGFDFCSLARRSSGSC